MTVVTVIKGIALIIFAISCVTIYHNTNSYEPSKRIIYIIIGTLLIYALTSMICGISTKGIEVKSEDALNDTVSVMKFIFTPINSMIILSFLGNIFGKVKDQAIDTSKAGKHILILLVAFIIILVFETSYIGNFVTGLLG